MLADAITVNPTLPSLKFSTHTTQDSTPIQPTLHPHSSRQSYFTLLYCLLHPHTALYILTNTANPPPFPSPPLPSTLRYYTRFYTHTEMLYTVLYIP